MPVHERLLTRNFVMLFLTAYLTFFTVDFLLPVLPFYVVDLGGSETAVGLLMGLFTFCSIILRPFQGRRLNRSGRKRLLISGVAVYFLGGLGLAALPSIGALFLFRALQGFGWGAFLLAYHTMTVDLAPVDRKGEAVGLMGMAPPLSLATAPLFGEFFLTGKQGYPGILLISAGAALAALSLAVLIKEAPRDAVETGRQPLISRRVLLPSAMIFFIMFAFGGILTFLPLLGEARDIFPVGPFFTVLAVVNMAVRPLTGKISDRWGRSRVFIPGLLISCTSFVVIALANSLGVLLLGALLLGCGFGAAHPAVMALAADRLDAAERGVGMATYSTAFDFGIVAGAIILGLLLPHLGFTALFIICALASLLPLAIYYIRIKK